SIALPQHSRPSLPFARTHLRARSPLRWRRDARVDRRGVGTNMTLKDLLIFGPIMVITWLLVLYFWPAMLLYVYKRAILVKGFGEGPVPINTLYTEPQALFADPLRLSASAPSVA